MESITQFFKRYVGGGESRKVILTGFGKLRAYSEHQPKLGESSGALVELRGSLYFEGILSQSSAGQKGVPEEQSKFDHWVIWNRIGSVIVARGVESDGPGGT